MSYAENPLQGAFPRPGKTLRVVLIGVFAIWLAFAIALNWAGASESVFYALCGNTERILHGEVWRLLTAPWIHLPVGTLSHLLSSMIGLYFLSPTLESRWGSARFARFLLFSAVFSYAVQMAVELVLPRSIAARLVPDYWFGAIPVVEAIIVAWALNSRGQVVRLFFVMPVSPSSLVLLSVILSLLFVVIGAQGTTGLIAPFGGLLAGWLFGSSPSPVRRLWLKLRLAQLDAEARREARGRKKRVGGSNLRVISGGRDDSGDDEPRRGPDKKWLN